MTVYPTTYTEYESVCIKNRKTWNNSTFYTIIFYFSHFFQIKKFDVRFYVFRHQLRENIKIRP